MEIKTTDQWFLIAGTLLGSLQHHDFIPWDDDADLMLHIRHRPTVQAAFRNLSPSYSFYSQDSRDKFYFQPLDKNVSLEPTAIGSKMLPNYPWAWPSIDIAYYTEIGPNLGQEYHNPIRKFNLSDLSPFVYRPFDSALESSESFQQTMEVSSESFGVWSVAANGSDANVLCPNSKLRTRTYRVGNCTTSKFSNSIPLQKISRMQFLAVVVCPTDVQALVINTNMEEFPDFNGTSACVLSINSNIQSDDIPRFYCTYTST
ncbi:hypothetical protein Aperf_G00000051988 [Anoplocephala perfoliata]